MSVNNIKSLKECFDSLIESVELLFCSIENIHIVQSYDVNSEFWKFMRQTLNEIDHAKDKFEEFSDANSESSL